MFSKKNSIQTIFYQAGIFLFLPILLSTCITPSMLVTKEQLAGDQSYNKYDYQTAISHYSNVLDASSKLGVYRNFTLEADVNRKVADAYIMQGKYSDALVHINEAFRIDSIEDYKLGMTDDIVKKGQVFLFMGDFKQGIVYLETSLQLAGSMDESLKSVFRKRAADIYLTIGKYFMILGNLDKAMEQSLLARNIFQDINDQIGLAEVYLTVAQLYLDKGNPDIAESMLKISLQNAEESGLKPTMQYRLLGTILSLKSEYEDAVNNLLKAVEYSNESGIIAQQIWSMIGLGDLLTEIGQVEDGISWYKKAHKLEVISDIEARSLGASIDLRTGRIFSAANYFNSLGSTTAMAVVNLRLGEYSLDAEDAIGAIPYLYQSLNLFNSGENLFGRGQAEVNLARAYLKMNLVDSASFFIESALTKTDFPDIQWQSKYLYGLTLELRGKKSEAINAYIDAIKIIETIRGKFKVDEYKSTFIDNKQEVYSRLIKLLLKVDRSKESFEYSERARARAFLDQISNRDIVFSAMPDEELSKKERIKRFELQKLNNELITHQNTSFRGQERRNAGSDQIRGRLQAVQDEYAELLNEIKINNAKYVSIISSDPATLEEIQSNLDEKSCLIEYWVNIDEIYIWIITKTGIDHEVVNINRASIESNVQLARKFIADNNTTNLNRITKILYTMLISPVEETVESYRNWIIVPKGGLHFLPFQVLLDDMDNYLVDKVNISYAPSASIWNLCRTQKISKDNQFLGMGLGDFSISNLASLPGTKTEVEEISNLFQDHDTYFSEAASETVFKSVSSKYDIIHLASHGIVNYLSPLFSYILLAPSENDDGRLLLQEIMETKISAKLVTLSACETGLGNISEGDELESLNRAFIYAGSPVVVSSLWSVADYPTSILMNNFYKYLDNYSVSMALTEAQRLLKKEYPDPFYWAPFVLNGNGFINMK